MSTNLLARIPFFTDLPADELDRIMAQLEIVNLTSGEILFREGDPGEHMYIVVSGDLEILMAPNTDNELILNRIPQGEYIGEMSLITGAPRTASVRAHGDVVLLSMSRTQLMDLLQDHPHLASTMVHVLSHRLDNTNVSTFRDLTDKNRQLQQAFDELKAWIEREKPSLDEIRKRVEETRKAQKK